ncbi:hypothetical protein GJ744_001052 [Endocarpon pusillum]|uniref:Uncharacterized protein n=1 Tax=Endocarpon pusillum TaxID=364733 RepID=A0A8H7AC73_9EURO|nr:hypothetical protein GJ744_001052 [Endocarpon pusillum]
MRIYHCRRQRLWCELRITSELDLALEFSNDSNNTQGVPQPIKERLENRGDQDATTKQRRSVLHRPIRPSNRTVCPTLAAASAFASGADVPQSMRQSLSSLYLLSLSNNVDSTCRWNGNEVCRPRHGADAHDAPSPYLNIHLNRLA